jgi:membrane-associated protease RseP (regulator of RpoE activity)
VTGRRGQKLRSALLPLVAVVLAGCVHPSVRQEKDVVVAEDAASATPGDGSTRVVRGKDPDSETLRMLEDGYARVGFSFLDADDVLKQARAVHADVVIIYPLGTGDHSDVASFWVKLGPPVFGVHMQDLSAELRTKSGAASGAYVTAVVKDSPAARAGIVRGDIIEKINDVKVDSAASLYDAVTDFAGQRVAIKLWRDHEAMEKEVQLNAKQ